jgi:uncharacterized protein YdeI (YjbR/CyaY-like superfamily)
MKPKYFRTPAEFREWLQRHHESAPELLVGYHKKGTGRPSMTWQESVDEALCFGWIDGVRRTVDETRYTIRFTPRRARSTWSAVNVKRVAELTKLGRMHAAGLAAFAARDPKRTAIYTYEQPHDQAVLAEEYRRQLEGNKKAWSFFQSQAPWYQRTASRWVMNAKKEETRLRRLAALIADSAQGRRIGPLTRPGADT